MQPLVTELAAFVRRKPFSSYHSKVPDFPKKLKHFLSATMDEVRLSRATILTNEILLIIDADDAGYFREGVLKREVTGTITYQSQRDHSAHTLYNWLLGWYIYVNHSDFSTEMNRQIQRRGWPNSKISVGECFGHMWQYVSLLHDVGYLFEGSLALIDPETQSRQTEVGVRIVKDYFESRFWLECGLSSIHERRILQDVLGILPPEFQYGQSLGRTADTLRDVGNLEQLTKSLREEMLSRSVGPLSKDKVPLDDLPRDAFDLWELHYEVFGSKESALRIRNLRKAFETFVYQGLPDVGLRVLDHGVCSGLLLLLMATYYYRLRYAIEHRKPKAGEEERVVAKFRERITAYEYDPVFWWTGIVWATAATAVHNIQQMKRPWQPGGPDSGSLKLSDDPLAYLGILVDCLEEWDRYFVFPLPGRLPMQGSEVQLGHENGHIVFVYPDQRRASKVKADLDGALEDWSRLVEIR